MVGGMDYGKYQVQDDALAQWLRTRDLKLEFAPS